MSPRKISDKSKHKRFEIRLDNEMDRTLTECAEKLHVTKTDVINKGIRMVKSQLDKENE